MPELDCIAEILSSAEPLSFNKKLLFARHLFTQCYHDFDMIFLPSEALSDNRLCPVDSYWVNIQK
ncbi:hypothetical protein BDW42DRAFT_164667 [Aspergillus taichungensis]|uniref:Uncharacterized protein n=1 Tax=Aspergillus taichungensis TaxID=482145 RepID=A0A2J5I1L3_9EURO|nr:hypothetical protein BDW42DRAFT_164667 [Aspergillus taichungensis]